MTVQGMVMWCSRFEIIVGRLCLVSVKLRKLSRFNEVLPNTYLLNIIIIVSLMNNFVKVSVSIIKQHRRLIKLNHLTSIHN